MRPQFKPLSKEVELDDKNLFSVLPEATHISFKSGRYNCQKLLTPDPFGLIDNYKGRKRRFIKKKGDYFRLPNFNSTANESRQFDYGRIEWFGKCANCQNFCPVQKLCEELCPKCLSSKIPYRQYPPLNP